MAVDRSPLVAAGLSAGAHGLAILALTTLGTASSVDPREAAVPTLALVWSAPAERPAQEPLVAAAAPVPSSVSAEPPAPVATAPAPAAPKRAAARPVVARAATSPTPTSKPSLPAAETENSGATDQSVVVQPSQPATAAVPDPVLPGATWSLIARVEPEYPLAARRNRREGEVLLRADVDVDGLPVNVELMRGSGSDMLDAAAIRAVGKWRFRVTAPMSVEIPVVFRLRETAAAGP